MRQIKHILIKGCLFINKKSNSQLHLMMIQEYSVVYDQILILTLDKNFNMDQSIFDVFDWRVKKGSLADKYLKLADYLSTADIIPLKCGSLRLLVHKIINDKYAAYLLKVLPKIWIKIIHQQQVTPIVYGVIEKYVSFYAEEKVSTYKDKEPLLGTNMCLFL